VHAFFDRLAQRFSSDPVALRRAAESYAASPNAASLSALRAAVESPCQELFRRLNVAQGGTAGLVRLRRDLLRDLDDHPQWAGLDADLMHLFKSWFNAGFLVLSRIDWHTSAVVLERLIQYEAVHQIQGWQDLHRRLEADRCCFAFFHPALVDEPLIFIEVALTSAMSARVQPLLDPQSRILDASRASAAMFYSITNCQEGLRGVSFGNFLIKRVSEQLEKEFPQLRTFATISPVPGFCDWLRVQMAGSGGVPLSRGLRSLLDRAPDPPLDVSTIGPDLEAELTQLCAYYLLRAKRRGAPLDGVARFHLANGASLERLNWRGDVSEAGMRRSFGLTVNYVYQLRHLDRNHERYATGYEVVASRSLQRLAGRYKPAAAPQRKDA
jgi:malonyl-CoA decarboxylase